MSKGRLLVIEGLDGSGKYTTASGAGRPSSLYS